MKKVLVINSGSSSIKYKLFDMNEQAMLAAGLLEQIGEAESRLTHRSLTVGGSWGNIIEAEKISDHREGFELIGAVLAESGTIRETGELFGIGHRVVHGGENFRQPAIIDPDVIGTIRELAPLAPLHNPANLLGIEVTLEAAPEVPQVAVFDTAFHQTIPAHAFCYALPYHYYEHHNVRRYGFHGTSHCYVAKQAASYLERPLDSLNLITLHLGNGASVAAIKNGKSVDTSMGMTPLEGLIMGTRSGDIDPAIIFYLGRMTGMLQDDVESLLNQHSGLKGMCGVNDMREIAELAERGEELARLAIDVHAYRIKNYIGAYYAVLGRVDALVFTAGVGENAVDIRHRSCEGLSPIGIDIDHQKNHRESAGVREIQSDSSSVKILIIPTDEELEIAEQTVEKINSISK